MHTVTVGWRTHNRASEKWAPAGARSQAAGSLRVLNVVYDERFGGPQSRILQVAGQLRRREIQSTVVTRQGDPTFPRMMSRAGVPHVELRLVRPKRSLDPMSHCKFVGGFWRNVMQLRTLIRKYRIDVVHNNGALHLQAPIAARREGIPLVWHLNDVHAPVAIRRLLPRVVSRLADVIAVASHAVAEYYFGAPPESDDRISVVYPPVDAARFSPETDGWPLRAELGISRDTPVIVTVANLCPGKGLEHLLHAAARVRLSQPDARFVIVGAPLQNRDSYRRQLLRLRGDLQLQRDVIFLGHRRDVDRILAAADVYVHASEREAAPMAVMEASASGLPVVASDVGGTREILDDGVTGFVVSPRSPEQIAAKVLALLASPWLAAEMGQRGAERMREKFSLDTCVNRHREIYLSAISHASRATSIQQP